MKDMMGEVGMMEEMMMAMMMDDMDLGMGLGVDDLADGDYDSDEIEQMAKNMGLSKKETEQFKRDIKKDIETAKKK